MKRERHNKALVYAISSLMASPICPYVADVLMYGSCARGKEKYQSDVDLLVILSSNAPNDGKFNMQLFDTRSSMMPCEENVAEIDVHFVSSDTWQNCWNTYYNNVRREGVSVWNQA